MGDTYATSLLKMVSYLHPQSEPMFLLSVYLFFTMLIQSRSTINNTIFADEINQDLKTQTDVLEQHEFEPHLDRFKHTLEVTVIQESMILFFLFIFYLRLLTLP